MSWRGSDLGGCLRRLRFGFGSRIQCSTLTVASDVKTA